MSFERVSALLLKGYFVVAIENLSATGLHTLTGNAKLRPYRVMKPLQCHSDTCVASVFVSECQSETFVYLMQKQGAAESLTLPVHCW